MKKLGLALSGGGAKGAFQQGVLEVLRDADLLDAFAVISGVSIGALHAFSVASHQLEASRVVWKTVDKSHAFKSDKSLLDKLKNNKFDVLNHGLFSTLNLETHLDQMLDSSKLDGREVFIGTTRVGSEDTTLGGIIAHNMKAIMHGHLPVEYIPLHTLSTRVMRKTLMASTAIPVVFKPVKMGDGLYVDGGVYNNTPLKPLLDAGCTHILVIDLFKYNLKRTFYSGSAEVMYVHPEKSLGRILDFVPEKSIERMAYGQHIAEEKITELKHFIQK